MNRNQRRRAAAAKASPVDVGGALFSAIANANSNRFPAADLYWMLYHKHPWVRACVNMISEAVAAEGFAVAKTEGAAATPLNAEDDPRVEAIHQFFSVIFVGATKRDTMLATANDLLVFGLGFWRRRYAGSLLVGLERLDPRLVVPKLSDDRKSIVSYVLKQDTTNVQNAPVTPLQPEIIAEDEVVLFKWAGGDVLLGLGSKLEGLDTTLAMDMNVRHHRNAFFKNGATTGAVLINKSAVKDQVQAAIKQVRDRAGSANAYLPLVLTGDWNVQSTAQTGKQEVDFVKGTGISREEVCAVYAMPPGKLVYSENSLGSSGKSEDDSTFQTECVLPLEELIYETISQKILQVEFDDLTDLAIVPRRRNRVRLDRITAAMNIVKCGGTGNQALDIIGLPQVTDPKYAMDVPLFLTTTGPAGFASDEALANEPAAEPVDPDLEKPAEVAKNSAKGKAWYGRRSRSA